MTSAAHPPAATGSAWLRPRDGHHARVTFEELFFDLVYVFAVTQVSHELLHHLTGAGVAEALILWFAVWLGWQYTCWFTNWFDPRLPRVRAVLFGTMLLGLVAACAIPQAFGERGLVFALAYVGMQVGRSLCVLGMLPAGHPLRANYLRITGWMCIAAVFWIGGAFAHHETRMLLWAAAVACEYFSPMFGFALPVLGRSQTSDWTIEGAHLTERCQLFVIVALGETLLATGVTLAGTPAWTPPVSGALLATFVGTLAMWWLYFGTASEDAMAAITRSPDPGRLGAYFHYAHAILVAGIIATAVGNDLVLAHPDGHLGTREVIVLVAGPAIYLLGSAVYKHVVYGRVPRSHLLGAVALAVLVPVGYASNLLVMGWLTTLVLLVVGLTDVRALRGEAAVLADARPHE